MSDADHPIDSVKSLDETPIEISVEDVKQLLDAEEPMMLVDCREPIEHGICQIDEAVLIPMNQTPARLDEFTEQPNRVVVFCHHGVRSLQVTHYLRSNGITAAQSMAGGIDQWSLQIDASLTRY
ncbi:MAG: rhodanese-like domain-containing protein [Planctomycetota bacterium]